jgi:hypothetical protein
MLKWCDMTSEQREKYGRTIFKSLAALAPRWPAAISDRNKYRLRAQLTGARLTALRRAKADTHFLVRDFPHQDQFGRTEQGALWYRPQGPWVETLIEILRG